MDCSTAAVMVQAKSVGLAFALTLFFRGLGLSYAGMTGGIVISIIEVLALIVATGSCPGSDPRALTPLTPRPGRC